MQGFAELQLPGTQSSIHQGIGNLYLLHYEAAQGSHIEQLFRQQEEGMMWVHPATGQTPNFPPHSGQEAFATVNSTFGFCCRTCFGSNKDL